MAEIKLMMQDGEIYIVLESARIRRTLEDHVLESFLNEANSKGILLQRSCSDDNCLNHFKIMIKSRKG